MPRSTRLSTRKCAYMESSDEEGNEPRPSKSKVRKKPTKPQIPNVPAEQNVTDRNDSSSESDLEAYLKPADEIDLNSSFFQIYKNPEENAFQAIENNIFAGINRLGESESEIDDKESDVAAKAATSSTTKINFQQLHDFTKKIEHAKKVIDKYEARKKAKLKKSKTKAHVETISDLLAKGEAKIETVHDFSKSLHSSDYESFSDSEKDWEEVEEGEFKEQEEKSIVPKEGVQITVELPGVMRKKKGIDLIASMKRRLNRIRKENQVFVHRVHLLCWIGHGNYINTVLNNENVLAMAMSLLPSQHCYPPERTDLNYLESVVKWFSKAIPVTDKILSKNLSLVKALRLQINRKQAYNKKMLVYIFICMLRALGIQCRLVLSFVVAPLRPPAEELHSLSTKNEVTPNTEKQKIEKLKMPGKVSETSPDKTKKTQSKSEKEPTTSYTKNKSKREKLNSDQVKQAPSNNGKDTRTKDNNKKDQVKNRQPETKVQSKPTKIEDTSKKKHRNSDSKVKSEPELVNNQATTVRSNKTETKKPNLKSLTDSKPKSDTKLKSNANKRKSKSKSSDAKGTLEIPQVDGANDSDNEPAKKTLKPNLKKLRKDESNTCPLKKHPKRLKSLPNYADVDSEDDFKPKAPVKFQQPNRLNLQNLKRSKSSTNIQNISPKNNNIHSDIIAIMKGRMAEERSKHKTKLVKHRSSNVSDYDSDYAPEEVKIKHESDDDFHGKPKIKVKQRVQVKKVEDKEDKKKKGVDLWVEVYLENEEKWISADVCKGEVHCINQLHSRASHPISYIVAWNNNNSVKDITQRYCPNWNTVTRKLRTDKKWWDATLRPYIGQKTIRDKEEDEELARLQLEKPLPKSISEFKDHPLYVLQRHLLKFQAIYPPDALTLGFIREEPVYARDCVYTLHSRDTWLKHAKVVKLGEKPYKVVKARPKYDKLSGQVITDQPLEIFGEWQVEDYVPPTAKDGIVPRNAYGNVELFKACMLPKGTVHLQLPGLNKLARRMNIDCVPAVVGFDVHSGWTHPTFDGFIVCEEFSEGLIAAWYIEQEEQEKRDLEKIEKRVYDNWKKLIKGLLIRERLKARYDYGAPSQVDAKHTKRKSKGPRLVSKKRRIGSTSESD